MVEYQKSLQPYNTFNVPALAKQFVIIDSIEKLKQLMEAQSSGTSYLVLGGGSNLLFTHDVEAIVLKNEIMGKEILTTTEEQVWIAFGSGENWHDIVLWTIEKGFGGLENLALIPGTVGAAPIQNIGAYGVELEQVFDHLEGVSLETGEVVRYHRIDCQFGYRNSIFKHALKGKIFITKVVLSLTRVGFHRLNTSYGAIEKELKDHGVAIPNIQDISNAVIRIRQSKLPDPKLYPNAGSFFKNPVVPKSVFNNIQTDYPNMPNYPVSKDQIKIPAGWLIEQCGWKGKKVGRVGTYKNQALVLVNYDNASGEEIWAVAQEIKVAVWNRFSIDLEAEVNII